MRPTNSNNLRMRKANKVSQDKLYNPFIKKMRNAQAKENNQYKTLKTSKQISEFREKERFIEIERMEWQIKD